jgi:hypothetical protein
MMNKTHVTSQSLINDASAYYVNLKNMGAWKIEMACNSQIIALTTQLLELKTELSKLLASKAPAKQDKAVLSSGKSKYILNYGVSGKLTTNSNTIWLSEMARLGIDVRNISTTTKVSSLMGCMLLTNWTSMIAGLNGGAKENGVL